ncbi:phage tail tape measure protein [Corynebacterium kalidii]
MNTGKKASKTLESAMKEGAENGVKAVEVAQKRAEKATLNVAAAEKKVQDAKASTEVSVKKVEAAELALESARSKSSSDVSKAEQALTKLRESGTATAEQLAAAEEKVEQARSAGGSRVASKEAALLSARQRSEKATDGLKQAEEGLVAAHRKAEDAADNVQAATKRMGNGLGDAESEATGLKGKLQELVGASDEAGSGFDGMAGKIGGLAGAAAGIASVGAAISAGMDVSGAVNRMNNQLGMTGDAAKALGDEVSSVMKSGLAGSAEEAAGAVGSLTSQFDYLGFEGEQTAAELSDNFLAFSKTFEVSIEEATQTAGQLIQNGLATDVEQAADLMTTAMQRVPAQMRDELPEIINEYGTNFRALGFDGEEAFGLLVSAADKGKWALDKTGDSLKEFTIRGSDMSTASSDAFQAIGLDAEAMARKIAAGGDGARDALKRTAEGLLEMENPAERANAAIALFGTPLEDLSVDQIPDFLESLSEGTGGMEGFAGASQELSDNVGNSLQGRMDALKGTVSSLAGDAFMKLWDTVQPITEWARDNGSWLGPLVTAFGTFAGVIGGVFAAIKIGTGIMAAFNAVMALNPFVLIAGAVAALVAGLVIFFTKTETGKRIWQGFVDFLKGAWEWISGVFAAGWDWIAETIPAAWQTVKDKTVEIWEGINQWLSDAWNSLTETVTNVWNGITGFFTWWWETTKNNFFMAWNAIQGFFVTAWANFTGLVQAIWNGISAFFSAWWAGLTGLIIGAWNGISNALSVGWQFISGLATTVWNAILTTFSSVWNAIVSVVTSLWNRLSTTISNGWNTIRNLASSVWNAIKDTISNAWNGIVSAVGNAVANVAAKMGEMVSSARAKVSEFVNKLTEIPRNVTNIFANAGQWLWDAGKAIIQGLIDGIKNMAGTVGDAILSVLPGGVQGFVDIFGGGGIAYSDGAVNVAGHASGSVAGSKLKRRTLGGREDHRATIAKAGEWRLWAEPETGGEAYIPLARSKRRRSTAILSKTAEIMGLQVVDRDGAPVSSTIPGGAGHQGDTFQVFGNGGIRTAKEMLSFAKGQNVKGQKAPRSLEGAPYVWGGGLTANWGDCSGAMSGLAAFMTGRPIQGRKFATGNQGSVLKSMGFTLGRGPAGSFRIGWFNGGPYGGHTAGTLPNGTNVEMGGGRGNGQIGGPAAAWNHSQFTDFAWIRGRKDGPTVTSPTHGTVSGLPGAANTTVSTDTGGDQNVVPVNTANTATAAAVAQETTPTTWSGIAGEFAKNWTEGMVQDALGVFGISDSLPPIFQAHNEYYAVDEKGEGEQAVNAQIAAAAPTDTATVGVQATPTSITARNATPAAKPASTTQNVPKLAVGQLRKGAYKKGASFYWEEIAKAASERRLGFQAAKIAGATALVESGDPLRMWASSVDTASKQYPHDSVGSDHDSSGLFQQRNNGAWGNISQRMNARASAGMFLNAMVKKYPNWKNMEPGAVAQGVQVSAFPSKYATKMAKSSQMMARFRGKLPSFNTGGPVQFGSRRGVDDVLALLGRDEFVLTADAADTLGRDALMSLNNSPAPGSARPASRVTSAPAVSSGGGDTYVFQAVNTDELNTAYRRAQAGRVKGAIGA